MQQILNLKQIELKTKFEYGQKVWCICDNRPFKSKINNINVNVIGGIDFVIKRIDITYKLVFTDNVFLEKGIFATRNKLNQNFITE